MRKQRGWIEIPRGFFETFFVLAAIGAVAALAAIAWGIWWLIQHVHII